MKMEKKGLSSCLFRRKQEKMPGFIDIELVSDSDSEWLLLSAFWGMFLNLWTPNTASR